MAPHNTIFSPLSSLQYNQNQAMVLKSGNEIVAQIIIMFLFKIRQCFFSEIAMFLLFIDKKQHQCRISHGVYFFRPGGRISGPGSSWKPPHRTWSSFHLDEKSLEKENENHKSMERDGK